MTEDEHVEMVRAGGEFWREFSALCNRYVREAPPHLRHTYTTYLGERTSIYGRDQSALERSVIPETQAVTELVNEYLNREESEDFMRRYAEIIPPAPPGNELVLLVAEFAYKRCERGENWEATRGQIYRILQDRRSRMPGLPWRPIAELTDQDRHGDSAGFLLLAPELIDEDCNVHGVGMGHWQDDGRMWHMTQEQCDAHVRSEADGCWLACKWSMTGDEWAHVEVNPTHYIRLIGATT